MSSIVCPLCVEQLQKLLECGCQQPGCNCVPETLVIHSRCHPEAGCDAFIRKGSDAMLFLCRKCKQVVIAVAVAKQVDYYMELEDEDDSSELGKN
jgi:hypothetical protein